MMTAIKYGRGLFASAGYTLAFHAHGWSTSVYGVVPSPGHVAVSEVLSVHTGLGVPGEIEILRHMPHTALAVG